MNRIVIFLLGGAYLFTQDLDTNLINETDSLKVQKEDPILVSPAEDSNESVVPEEVKGIEESENKEEVEEIKAEESDKKDENQPKISGLTYYDFTYSDDKGVFDVKRTYLKYSRKLSDKHYFNFILDVGRDNSGLDTDQRLSAYLKKAQFTMKLKEKSFLYFGLIGMNMFNIQEKTWGYRYINKSAMDQYGFSSSADFGLGYKQKFGKFSLSTFLTNGEGYKSSGNDEFQKLSIQLLYGNPNLRSVASGVAFNGGLVLSVEPYESNYATVGEVLPDDGQQYLDPASFEVSDGVKSVVGLFGGFTQQAVLGGFEYNQSSSFDDAYTATDGGDGLFGTDDTVSGLYSTYGDMKTSSLVSTYLSIGITPKFNMLFRADIYDENTAEDAIEDSHTKVFMGMHFPLSSYMALAPVIVHTKLESRENDPDFETASTDFRLNFKFKF